MAYCTSDLVKYLSQVTYGELAFATLVAYNSWVDGTLIPQAENFIDNYCGGRHGTHIVAHREGTLRRFNSNQGSLYLDGSGKNFLFFPPYFTPLTGIGSLTVDGAAVANANLYINDQFIQYDGGVFRKGIKNVYFKGTHGYGTITPHAVQYVCGQLCANLLLDMKKRVKVDGVLSTGVGGMGFTSALSNPALMNAPWIFTPDLRSALDEYRFNWIDLG